VPEGCLLPCFNQSIKRTNPIHENDTPHDQHQAHAAGTPPPDLQQQLEGRLAETFVRLRWLAAARGKLRDCRRLVAPGVAADGGAEVVPLVRQVLGKILLQVGCWSAAWGGGKDWLVVAGWWWRGGGGKIQHATPLTNKAKIQPETQPAQQADNRDLQHQGSQSLGGILKAGLGRFGLGAAIGALGAAAVAGAPARAAHEYPAVLIFVVGGLSMAEWRGVRQELEQHTFGHKPVVLLGGTALLAPCDVVKQLLS